VLQFPESGESIDPARDEVKGDDNRCPSIASTVVSFAKLMLGEQDEFYPFGATMSSSGEITNIGAAVEGDDHPLSKTLIDLMTERFRQQATKGEIRAAAICCDVRVIPPGQTDKTRYLLRHRTHLWRISRCIHSVFENGKRPLSLRRSLLGATNRHFLL